MPFERPSLADLINRTQADIISRLPDPDLLRRSDAMVYARVLAGVVHGLYGYLDWLARQMIYDTAETEMLDRWASIWGIVRKPATSATGTVTFTGNNGAVIAGDTVLIAPDGVAYAVISSVVIAGGSAAATVTATNSGLAGNRTTGQLFTLQSAVAGVSAVATAGAMTGGADIESDDSLRDRLLLRIRTPPQGGAANDYITWALEVPGVTRAWVYPEAGGPGTVTVRFMMDDTYANGIPLSGDVALVDAYIQQARPVTADVTVLAPVASPLNLTIAALSPSTPEVKAAIEAELRALILRESSPGGTLLLSHIREAISIAQGEIDHSLTTPSANVVASAGNITTLGTITWT